MLFAGLWCVMVVKGAVSWCGNQNKPVKGKQMFVDKVIEKEVFVTGKSERKRNSGVPTAWRRIAVRYGLLGRSEAT